MLDRQSYRKLDSYLPKVPNSATKRGKNLININIVSYVYFSHYDLGI